PVLLPVRRQEVLLRDRELPVEVLGHQVEDALVAGVLVVRLEAAEHHHVRPEVVLAGGALDGALHLAGAEEAVVALARERRLDPDLRLLDLVVVAEEVGAVAEALEPVRHLLPAALALAGGAEPGVVLLAEELADLAEVAVEAGGLEFELLAEPAARRDGPDRQL